MTNKFNVIIDTNVIVSSLLTPNSDAATAQVLNLFYNDYEIVMDDKIKDSKLITGNLKNYPINPKIMTPNDFLKIYNKLS